MKCTFTIHQQSIQCTSLLHMYLYSDLIAGSFDHLIGDAFDFLLDDWIRVLPAQKWSEAPDRVLKVCHGLIPSRRAHQSLLLRNGHHCPVQRYSIDAHLKLKVKFT